MRIASGLVSLVCLAACGDDPPGPTVVFDLDGPLAGETFFDLPFPSDLRLTAEGRLDTAGFPNPRGLPVIEDLVAAAALHVGATMAPIVYFRFEAAPPPADPATVLPLGPAGGAFVVDIDPDSPDLGTFYPTVAVTMEADDFAPAHLVAVATRPGVVLRPTTTYAVVITRAFAPGVERSADFAALTRGDVPASARGALAAATYGPLWSTLQAAGVAADDVLVASVLTTGDVVAELRQRSEAVRDAHDATLADLAGSPAADRDGFCELHGSMTLPVFQRGTPPFNSGGDFELDGAGSPVAQGMFSVPISITLPDGPMPVGGWPLVLYFHGSGGLSDDVTNSGPTPSVGASPTPGLGPAYVLAGQGIAAASAALPVNPERLPGASDIEYINFSNLAAFPFTFQTGVLEQRLFLDALLDLQIDASAAPGCAALASGTHRFDATRLGGMGQSMGGMYTNLVGAVEPRLTALVPTGAGGFWNTMILVTEVVDDVQTILSALFGASPDRLHFAYPPLALLEQAWEVAEPGVFVPRLARRPLDGLPSRQLYVPVGEGDLYFPTPVLDAMALAYGNQQAGDEVWPEMQAAMALGDFDGLASYPVAANRMSEGGTPYTGVVVQYPEDGIIDGHQIYRQYDDVKHQYGCFLRTHFAGGPAVVPAPAALGTACAAAP